MLNTGLTMKCAIPSLVVATYDNHVVHRRRSEVDRFVIRCFLLSVGVGKETLHPCRMGCSTLRRPFHGEPPENTEGH